MAAARNASFTSSTVTSRLRVGHWEGYAEDEIAERWPEQWQRWRSQPHALEMEGRETLAELHTCVAGALEERSPS